MLSGFVGWDTPLAFYFDNLGAPVTGATGTISITTPRGAALVTSQALTEEGLGWYTYTLDAASLTVPGLYRITGSLSKSGVDQGIDDYLLAVYPAAGTPPTRLWQLRHSLARLLGDLTLGVSQIMGSATVIRDAERVEDVNAWRGAWIYVYAGTNRGAERRCTSFTTPDLTVATAWGSNCDTTTRYELHSRWSVADYQDFISQAVQEVAGDILLPATDETVLLTSSTTYEYTVPAPFVAINAVYWKDTADSTDDWHYLDWTKNEWAIVPGARLLRIPQVPSTTARLRLCGQVMAGPLVRDDAWCVLPPELLRYKAAALALAGKVHSPGNDRDAAAQLYGEYQRAAEALLSRARKGMAANARRVR